MKVIPTDHDPTRKELEPEFINDGMGIYKDDEAMWLVETQDWKPGEKPK